ncbi:MAG: LLM class flavin-dependent oxidoreductase, partial [Chloroflexota bacterium]
MRTMPRPVQRELPVWVTASGNPETFRMAGEKGHNVLTHLLGQTIEQLGEKLVLYRQARQENGHQGPGHVTLMLHTFIGDDIDTIRELVRQPMIEYLKSSIGLIKQAAWDFPTLQRKGKDQVEKLFTAVETGDAAAEDMEALLDFAFERYFETSGLFGTPESCLALTDQLKQIGVDEIGCLIDFGIKSKTVLAHLNHLNQLKTLANPIAHFNAAQDRPEKANADALGRVNSSATGQDFSIAAQIERYQVTHLQCTPSMANMLMTDTDSRAALSTLQNLLVGGEALPVSLAKTLQAQVSGNILNMYGPTETTIWSSVHQLQPVETTIPIGKPIANTEIYIVDTHQQPVPIGVEGELLIGGDGVARGYLNRPQLTAERFINHPFRDDTEARLYRTGDLSRYRPDGAIDFLGRLDYQVKIRGHRIELGEIEARLDQHPEVKESVVVAWQPDGEAGAQQLVAYLVATQSERVNTSDLRHYIQTKLPEYMIPGIFVWLDAFPLTPNGKVNRKALPDPDQNRAELAETFVEPRTPVEAVLAEIWADLMRLERVGIHDNFFELGGHSLLAVQLISRVRDTFSTEVPLAALFQRPTVAQFAEALLTYEAIPTHVEKTAELMIRRAQEKPEIKELSSASIEKIAQPTPIQTIEPRLRVGNRLPSLGQERVWFLDQIEPGAHYNDFFVLQLSGQLDQSALQESLEAIYQRHEVLRTSFVVKNGILAQEIDLGKPLPFQMIDLQLQQDLPTREAMEETITDVINQPFNLAEGPLWRVVLWKLTDESKPKYF